MDYQGVRYFDLLPEVPLIDDGSAPEIYCDCVATLQTLGTNFRAIYATYVRTPRGLLQRYAAVKIVRPIDSLVTPAKSRIGALLRNEGRPLHGSFGEILTRSAH